MKSDIKQCVQKFGPVKLKNLTNIQISKNKSENFLKRKPLSALGINKKESIKRTVSNNLKEKAIIETIPEEEENTLQNTFQHLSFKKSLRPFSSMSDKFSNLDYSVNNKPYLNEESYQFRVEIRDLTPEKSSESNVEVSTSGSYNKLSKNNNKIFNFENLEDDFNYNNLKQTACFSPQMKNDKNFRGCENDLTVKKIQNILKINNNSNGQNQALIKTPSSKIINTNNFSKINNQPDRVNIKRNNSFKKSPANEKLMSPRIQVGIDKVSNLKNFKEFKKNPSCEKVEQYGVGLLPNITPPLSTRRKPNMIQNELKSIFNVAQNFQEDPEVKIKLDSLIKNIADIKTVLQLKTKNRSIISAPLLKKEKKLIKSRTPSFL
jgi:hypothetical protein